MWADARNIQEMNEQLIEMLSGGALLNKAASTLLCVLCLFCLGVSLYKALRHRWDSLFYLLLCVSVFVWALCSLLGLFFPDGPSASILARLSSVGFVPVPALLCLHIQKQVSYKEPGFALMIALFAAPALFVFALLRDAFFPGALPGLPAVQQGWWYFPLFCLYGTVSLVRCYLLCFSVFYQMPRRMRSSTQAMLVAITATAALPTLHGLQLAGLWQRLPQNMVLSLFLPLLPPVLCMLVVYPLYSALRIMPASDIIVTSREFVMSGLATTVLVLGRRKQILDWNRTVWAPNFALPKPKFREPFELYRKRLLKPEGSRVSPHSENILIVDKGDKEAHFHLRMHEMSSEKREFGSLVEIVEITQVYNILHYFEGIAYHDMLTEMNNRNAYLAYVQRVLQPQNMPLLIFVGDVDGLKQVNDVQGHLMGDKLLSAVARAIKKALPPGGFAARVGGDEFVMLAPGGSEEMAKQFVQTIMALCAEEKHESFGVPSLSWGYAIMQDASQGYNEVFSQADAMMYAYKKGRQQFSSSGLLPQAAPGEETPLP